MEGWAAVAAAVLTVTGLVTLFAFFGTGSALLGALNDVNTILMALVTVPVALALQPMATRASGALASGAVAADLLGVALAAGFSAALLARLMTSDTTLLLISLGNGFIGLWLLITAALILTVSVVPSALGWLGILGGAGLAVASWGFPLLGRQHPVIGLAGAAALIGLVAFFGWTGVLMLQGRLGSA